MHRLDDMILQPGPANFDDSMAECWKFELLEKCLPQAMSFHRPHDTAELKICGIMAHDSKIKAKREHLASFQEIAARNTFRLTQEGYGAAALAWGRSSYVAGRHVNHASLDFFEVMRSCNAMRSLDLDGQQQVAVGPASIPRRLVQFRPEDQCNGRLDSRVSWSNRNPSYEYTSFNDAEAENYLQTRFGSRVHGAYATASTPYRKSVIFALAWLFEHGGVYADRHEVCNASLDTLIGSGCDFVMPWHAGRPSVLWPQFIASRPSNPLLARLLHHVVRGSEWMTATGHSLDDWMIYGAGGITMTLIDHWCEEGAWLKAGEVRLLDNDRYRSVVDRSDLDVKLFTEHQPDRAPKVPAIPTIPITAIVKAEDRILFPSQQPQQHAALLLPDHILPPGAELVILSNDPASSSWQERQQKPALAPATGVYWLRDLKLSGHGCLWKGNDFIQLGSYLSDVAEGETRGGAWQTPWTHKAVRVVEEPVIVAFSPGYSCYGHWLVDELPRIGLLKLALGASFRTTKFIFPEKIRSWGKALLEFFFEIDDSQILYFNHEREMWHLKSAIVPTFLHRNYQFQPFVRDFFSAFAPKDAVPHRRVCLSRRDWDESKPDQRIFIQRKEFEQMAVDRGYEVFAPEELSLSDQIRLMSETAVQIGEHGSAQHGSIFSRHSTIVGSINPLTSVQVNLGRIAKDRNVLLFPETTTRDASGSLRFGCSTDGLVKFFNVIDRLQLGQDQRSIPKHDVMLVLAGR